MMSSSFLKRAVNVKLLTSHVFEGTAKNQISCSLKAIDLFMFNILDAHSMSTSVLIK